MFIALTLLVLLMTGIAGNTGMDTVFSAPSDGKMPWAVITFVRDDVAKSIWVTAGINTCLIAYCIFR
jgi:hypothetical protein